MDRLRNAKLPSRNWSIFIGVVGTIVGSVVYDKIQVKAIQNDLRRRAALIGDSSATWNAKARIVMVYLDPTHWSNHWFDDFVKPVFDAGAVEYILVQKDHSSEIIESVRNIVWDAKEVKLNDLVVTKNAGWFGVSKSQLAEDAKKEEQLAIKTYFPHLYKPKYDSEMNIIGIGPIAWRHILYGLKLGIDQPPIVPRAFNEVVEPSDSDPIASQIELTVLGYIAGKNLSGFAHFPSRFAGWFNKRSMASQIGEDALKIVNGNAHTFTPVDALLGSKDYRPLPIKDEKDKSEIDIANEKWSNAAENELFKFELTEKLKIYK